ncbi:hypothetical protein ABIB62_003283 [Mucilaginibacter sp. UYP25]|uniref:hypothetical protein n=1 Tax=unclassified Mucilaginibacter TaxID=2617802 RepID=UPI003398AAF6
MEKKNYFNLISAQRYFHLVALNITEQYSTVDYYKNFGNYQRSKNHTIHQTKDFVIEHVRIITDTPYYGGTKDYSVKNDGLAPFNYDLFTIELKPLNILILGFPFKFLAKDILENLIRNKLLQHANFIKPDLTKLIKENNDSALMLNNFSSHFSGVELSLNGDTNISSVNLDGDRPLDSTVYKTFFYNLIQRDECSLEKCSLKNEILEETTDIPKTKSNIHLDLFGNYKLYIHGSGNNIFTIPSFFKALTEYQCIKTTLTNPIIRLKDE